MPAAKPKVEKICPTCESVFYVRPSVAEARRCCSVECQGLWKKSKRSGIECATCGVQFIVCPSDIKYGRKYCSRNCWNVEFGKMMTGNKHRKGISSWNKGIKGVATGRKGPRPHMRGENNPFWKGGSDKRHSDMGRIEYKNWRIAVFERDNYTCQICEQYSGVLHADHIKKWADNEELRYAVDNGRTLCVPCHYYITFKRKMSPGTRWCGYMAKKEG